MDIKYKDLTDKAKEHFNKVDEDLADKVNKNRIRNGVSNVWMGGPTTAIPAGQSYSVPNSEAFLGHHFNDKKFGIMFGEKPKEDKALRYNKGKLRYDLVHPVAEEGLVKVLTKGVEKYAERNWEKGMKWSKVISSLKRHLAAIEKGEDYDQETGLLHADHLQCNAHFLSAYYKIYPEGDDRPHNYLKKKRIGLDIDDVLADWVNTFCMLSKQPIPTSWHFGFTEKIQELLNEGLNYEDVLENLPVKTKPCDIPFEPTCYITNRNHTDVKVAERWIAKNGFPQVPVIQTSDKVQACKDMNLDIFVDDKFDTFVDLNNAGIMCYLYSAPHNERYNVGAKRIYSLKELV